MRKKLTLLYITIDEVISDTGGVSNKLFNKVSALRKEVDVCHYLNAKKLSNNDGVSVKKLGEDALEVEIGVKKQNRGYLNSIRSDIYFYELLSVFINENYKPDRILMRYPLAGFGLLKLSKRFFKKIVFEHNAFEIAELRLHLQNRRVPFSFRPSLFFYWFQEMKIPILTEKYLAGRIFSNIHSGACVTSEIAIYQSSRSRRYKTFVSSNFYQVSLVTPKPITWDSKSELLSLGFIVNNFAPWYGIERLLNSFSEFQANYKLYLVGIDPNDGKLNELIRANNIRSNFHCLGRLSQKDLGEFYHNIHLSFGSLATYKSNAKFASTLKVKESLAYGKPVILGYFEEDLYSNPEFDKYYIQFPNDDSLIDFKKIQDFAQGFYSDINNQLRLHELALKTLDVSVKMKKLVENILTN